MEELPESLPPPAGEPEAAQRVLWQWVGGVAGLVLVAVVVAGILFKVPYVALVPGTARDTEELVEVEGIDVYPSDGRLLFTTVRVRQEPNLWEYLWLRNDDDAEILPEDVILQGRTPDENRELNLQLMTDSKDVAIAVALEQLGYDAIRSDGVLVLEVQAGTAADGRLEPGDALVAIDDAPLATTGDLLDALATHAPGDTIKLLIEPFDPDALAAGDDGDDGGEGDDSGRQPGADREEIRIVLGARDEDPGAAFLGIGPTDRVHIQDDFGFELDIDSGSVGGPSAGLAFTLAVLDQLTEGELTGGSTVAVTGTIDPTGRVGAVGGVVQKAAAVRDAGADVFIIPAELSPEEIERVRDKAGDELTVIPVYNLAEALTALDGLGGEVEAVEEFAAGNLS